MKSRDKDNFMAPHSYKTFPKIIWIVWWQGWNDPPWLVQQALESWRVNNPNWTINLLSDDNIRDYIKDSDYLFDKQKEITPAAKADIARLSLLKNYGGVWADASMFCMQPLDTWIETAVQPAGLWMYHGHGAGMSARNGPASWFIASTANGEMITTWKNLCDDYWKNREVVDKYFWMDRLFRKAFESNKVFQDLWSRAPYLYCESKTQAHALARGGRKAVFWDNPLQKKIFEERPPYALKLWWKDWKEQYPGINIQDSKNTNGYFAIQASKKMRNYQHNFIIKKTYSYYLITFCHDIIYFIFKLYTRTRKIMYKYYKKIGRAISRILK